MGVGQLLTPSLLQKGKGLLFSSATCRVTCAETWKLQSVWIGLGPAVALSARVRVVSIAPRRAKSACSHALMNWTTTINKKGSEFPLSTGRQGPSKIRTSIAPPLLPQDSSVHCCSLSEIARSRSRLNHRPWIWYTESGKRAHS